MNRIVTILFFGWLALSAGECGNKLFTLHIGNEQQVTIGDILQDIAGECHISVLVSDDMTSAALKRPLALLYVDDYSLDELLDVLLKEHNLFYTYDAALSRLKVASVMTRSFNIDYINLSEMRTETVKAITVGASSGESGGGNTASSYRSNESEVSSDPSQSTSINSGGGINTDFTSIKAVSEFTFWNNLYHHISQMLQRDGDSNMVKSAAMINRDAGIITVTGSYRQLQRVGEYIDNLQRRMHRQVMLEAHVIEVQYLDEQQVGIDWSQFDLALSAGAFAEGVRDNGMVSHDNLYGAGFDFSMEGLLVFLKKYGDVEVLSTPKVMTLNNQPAVINVGDQLNYRTETGQLDTVGVGTPSASTTYSLGSVFVGLTLNIIPEITDENEIILRINPVNSRLLNDDLGSASVTRATESGDEIRTIPPDVKIKQMTSIVKVKDGSKVLVGGLMEKEDLQVDNKVPVVGDVPFLGRLFHSTDTKVVKKEFFVVIIPTLIEKKRNFPSIDETEMLTRITAPERNESR